MKSQKISAVELRQRVARIIAPTYPDIGAARADLNALRKETGVSQEKLELAIKAEIKLLLDGESLVAKKKRFFERLLAELPPGKTVREWYTDEETARIAEECGLTLADFREPSGQEGTG